MNSTGFTILCVAIYAALVAVAFIVFQQKIPLIYPDVLDETQQLHLEEIEREKTPEICISDAEPTVRYCYPNGTWNTTAPTWFGTLGEFIPSSEEKQSVAESGEVTKPSIFPWLEKTTVDDFNYAVWAFCIFLFLGVLGCSVGTSSSTWYGPLLFPGLFCLMLYASSQDIAIDAKHIGLAGLVLGTVTTYLIYLAWLRWYGPEYIEVETGAD